MNEKGKLVERITLKIKMFDTGNWEWTVRQRFIKEPRVKLEDMLKILDEVKAEIIATEKECQTNEGQQTDAAGQTLKQEPSG